ncbi:IPTL-CTERM sorting domain-containing protein [Brevundimonas diminuta]|uniref:IPTL-CTERM sorting domain-containing protein n=1 Tax=Brevundimonas diminuta TaxID=293 RepID=UPI002096CC91|nr:IPTL-CTERM sorting domain-containing protein [Brevundimonas diminuta]MCO8031218.1 IPTL-CTERM sorting domain-containing protein [Brevundimonas diminuta]
MKFLAGLALGLLFSLGATAAAAQNPDVSVTLTASPQSPKPGDRITFRAVVTNSGPGPVTDLEAEIWLPAGLTPSSVSTNAGTIITSNTTGGLVDNVTLGDGEGFTLITEAVLPSGAVPGTVLTGVAEVRPSAPDPDPTDNRATATATVGSVTPAPVPTLTEWAMILLGVLLAGGAALTLHRRRQFH